MQHKRIEYKALIVGIVVNVLMVIAGMVVFFISGLKAMFLDAAFTAISVLSGLVAATLSSRTVRTTERFPNGLFALEPIYAIGKAMVTMSLLIFTLIDVTQVAYDYFVFGYGFPISMGPVVIYEIATVASCAVLYVYYTRQNELINYSSTMLTAESKSTFIDGMMSLGIGVVAIVLVLLPQGTPLDFLHYTGDFFITLAIVVFTIREPIAVLRDAFVELVGGVHDNNDTNAFVEDRVQSYLPEGTELDKVLVFKMGMSYSVEVYLTGVGPTIYVNDMVYCKKALEEDLASKLHLVDVDFVFD